MWELAIGYGSISNSSLAYLEKTWLEIHERECPEKPAVVRKSAVGG
jgi:hypothetical protein